MKKILILIISLTILAWNTFATNYKLTSSDILVVNKISSKIQSLLDKNTLQFRETLSSKIFEIQEEYKSNLKLFTIFEEIKINTHLNSYYSEYTEQFNNYNIDYGQVRQSWLDWHNSARSELNLNLYTYDKRLDNTAYEWSKEQKWKQIMSHKRSPDWPFYDYHEIEKWFTDRGVRCLVRWWATSSESIWKFWFDCNDWDCTQELTDSIKVIFDIYMAEKTLPFSQNAHYRWIVHTDLTKIWLWISIRETNETNYYEYYITTHYCTEFKD